METLALKPLIDPIRRFVVMELVDPSGQRIPLATEMMYDTRDPHAVNLIFETDHGPKMWTFARINLRNGLHNITGEGDVQVQPSVGVDGEDKTIIILAPPGERSVIEADTDSVMPFVEEMFELVPEQPFLYSNHDLICTIAEIELSEEQ